MRGSNVYYDPEKLGLSVVGSLDENLSYEFNILAVFQHSETGRLFYATDAGCSCPTPFEDYHFNGPDDTDLTEIGPGDAFVSFRRKAEGWPVPLSEREDLIAKVEELMRRKGSAA